MKTIATILFIAFLFCLLPGCNKQKNSYNVYIFSNKKDEYTHLKLFINDKEKGDVPYFTEKVTFDNDSLMARTLKVNLVADKYPFIIKDQWGNVKVDGNVKVKRKSLSTEAVLGELITTTKGHDVIIEIKYN
jgi:hypothetical protein